MTTLPLHGASISLRDWQLGDLEPYAYWLRPDHRWHELDGPYYHDLDEDEIPGVVEHKRAEIEAAKRTPRNGLAIADAATDRLLGAVKWYWQSQETLWLSIGIVIYDPHDWGQGIGYQALGLWSEYLLASMPELVRLDLRTWSGNTGMMRLAEKLGYREEARFRMARIVNGRYYDGLGYGVLREEWIERYPQGFAAQLA